METTDQLFYGNGSDDFYDVFAELDDFDVEVLTPERLRLYFERLPEHTRNIAHAWGLSDTVFRDEAFVYYRDNPQKLQVSDDG